jgi:hypothetical protein
MRAESALLDAYAEWHRLAVASRQAIQSRNWPFVLECQEVILKLQPRISQLSREAVADWQNASVEPLVGRKRIRSLVLELINLLESNNSLIKTVREHARSQYQQRQQASRKLKRLHQSYAVVQPTAWSSFS